MSAPLQAALAAFRRGSFARAFDGSIRTSLVSSAILTSIVSKIATLLLQFGALPLAARSLGAAQYAAYLVVAAGAGWISLGFLGAGPAVTRGVARAVAAGDMPSAKKYIGTGLFIAVTASVVLCVVILIAVGVGAIRTLVGPQLGEFSDVLPLTFAIIAVGPLGALALGAVDSAQAGLIEHYRGNLWTFVGTIVSVVAIVAVSATALTLPFLAAAISVPFLGARILNALSFFRRHPGLTPAVRDVQAALLPEMAVTGFGFVLLQMGGYLSMGFTLVLAARQLNPVATASVGVVLQIAMMLGGLVTMATQPLWPALLQAKTAGDMRWAVKAYRATLAFGLVVALTGGALIAFLGGPVSRLLYGGVVDVSQELALSVGVFFVASVWAHIHSYVVIGLGSTLTAGAVQLTESVIAILLVPPLIGLLGPAGVGVALAVGVLGSSAWLLPLITRRALAAPAGTT